jgi:hypothetical protein
VEIEAALCRWQPHDLGQPFEMRRVGILADRDQRRRGVVKHAGGRRSSSVSVDHHAEWLAVGRGIPYGQMRIVDALGPRTDHDRVRRRPQPVGIGSRLGARDAPARPIRGRDPPVKRRPELPDHNRAVHAHADIARSSRYAEGWFRHGSSLHFMSNRARRNE